MIALLGVVMMTACSDDDDFLGKDNEYAANQAELLQTWKLIGYGSEEDFHMLNKEFRKESEIWGYRFWIAFRPDGSFDGQDAVNQLWGKYTCKGNQIKIEEYGGTEIDDNNNESHEFGKRFQASSIYGIKDGKKLRMYYSDKEFLYFESIDD